jgi:nitrite reductase/ring-hydroxylating ferredoxin subunit
MSLPSLSPGCSWRRVAECDALAEGGDGVRFTVPRTGDGEVAAFVVRYDGEPRAFLNRCAHVPVELDWQAGRFFDDSGLYLVCATHGAMYSPEDGRCAGGPCRGRGLEMLRAAEADGSVWVEIVGSEDAK